MKRPEYNEINFSIHKMILRMMYDYLSCGKYYLKHIIPNRKLLKKTASLRDSCKGKSAFVFGNGPSIRLLDPEKIRELRDKSGFSVFALNCFLQTDFGRKVRPTHFVLSDPLGFVTGTMRENHFQRLIRDHGYSREYVESIEKEIHVTCRQLINEKTPLFIPITFRSFLRTEILESDSVYFYPVYQTFFSNNVRNILRPLGINNATTYRMLCIAHYLGYEKIYLCGLENDYRLCRLDRNNRISFFWEHFFDTGRWITLAENTKHLEETYSIFTGTLNLTKFPPGLITNLNPDSLIGVFSKIHDLDIYAKEHTYRIPDLNAILTEGK